MMDNHRDDSEEVHCADSLVTSISDIPYLDIDRLEDVLVFEKLIDLDSYCIR